MILKYFKLLNENPSLPGVTLDFKKKKKKKK